MKKLLAVLLALTLLLALAVPGLAQEAALRVAVVLSGSLGDRSFYDSANAGLQALLAEYPDQISGSVIECKNDASMFTTNLISAAEQNDVVVAVGWEFWDALTEYVPQMPETKFIFIDNGLDGVGDNLLSITYAQNEGSFLVGYIAAKLSQTGKIGAVGGEDADTINDFIVGYEAGAQYANPQIQCLRQYAGTYDDPAKGKENALALYDMGCDVVFQIASRTGEGVFEAAEETGNYAIGVDSDQKYINPQVIVCSMVKEVGKSIQSAVSALLLEGEFAGGTIWEADMATGFIDVAYGDDTMPQQVSDELKAEVEAIKQDIISGAIQVPSVFED
ncbi:MAG TPA: BMP family ABC transporter substrate-binding protein [Candidatus Excrementavichristensenella intestinipullorum]|nr:BMP family ABC transporter substrate-binding protein [Candidatus Excrementavichristensenella intestinipullorum]